MHAGMYFFDVGGTLVEPVLDPADATLRILDAIGAGGGEAARRDALAAVAHAYAAGIYAPSSPAGERALWRALATVCLDRLPGGARREWVAALEQALAGYFGWYRPIEGMPELIADLRRVGRPVGIISNWPPSLDALLAQLGFGVFPLVACSGPLRCTKPDPAIFRWALCRAGVPAAECWYVGNDPDADYVPAAALGMRAVLWDPSGRFAGSGMRRAGAVPELRAILGLGG